MARGTKAQPQATEDLWHLGIDDLFASQAAPAAGAVAGPFVINLTLASVPSGAMPRAMPRFERLCIYQLQHAVDERRQEFRLRLGIIETELEADAILAAVREHYPAARKETASEEDTRAVALRMARSAQRAAAAKRTESQPSRPHSQNPQQQKSQAQKPQAQRPPAQKPHGKKAADGSKRDAKARANVTPPTPAKPAAPPQWNLDDVLPEFAGHAAVKCDPVAPLKAAPPAAAPTPVAAAAVVAKHAKPVVARPIAPPAPKPVAAVPVVSVPVAAVPVVTELVMAEPVVSAPAVVADVAPAPVVATPAVVESATFEFTMEAPTEPVPVAQIQAPEPVAQIAASAPEPGYTPAPVAIVPVQPDLDSDPNAVTTEVEALTFTIDAPLPEVAPEELSVQAPMPVPTPMPAPALVQDELEITVEAPHIFDAVERESSPSVEMLAFIEESSPTEITIEAATLSLASPSTEVPTLSEAPTLEVASPAIEAPIELTSEALTLEVTPPRFEAPPLELTTPAIQLLLETPPAEAPPPIEVPPTPVAPPPAASIEDSGNLERLVAQIDTMVETLEEKSPATPPTDATPAIDSTQTHRALTPLELAAGDTASRWFVVQLVLSEHEIDPDQVPSLDIFTEYRLYRVMGLDNGNVMHALRLGFFGSEPAAQAVAGYLAVFFDSPTITRVSIAERERFAEDNVAARKNVGNTGSHSVIELTSPAPLPKRPERAVVPPESGTRASGSLWSRLVAPLKR